MPPYLTPPPIRVQEGGGSGRGKPASSGEAALRRARKGASLRDEDSRDKGLSSLGFPRLLSHTSHPHFPRLRFRTGSVRDERLAAQKTWFLPAPLRGSPPSWRRKKPHPLLNPYWDGGEAGLGRSLRIWGRNGPEAKQHNEGSGPYSPIFPGLRGAIILSPPRICHSKPPGEESSPYLPFAHRRFHLFAFPAFCLSRQAKES